MFAPVPLGGGIAIRWISAAGFASQLGKGIDTHPLGKIHARLLRRL